MVFLREVSAMFPRALGSDVTAKNLSSGHALCRRRRETGRDLQS
jgi:hypothetical protein